LSTVFKNKKSSRKTGVRILDARSFAVNRRQAPEAVRIGLGEPEHIDQVTKGLDILANLLEDNPDHHESFI